MMRPSDPELMPTVFHPNETTHEDDVERTQVVPPPAVIVSAKRLKTLHPVLDVYVAVPDLKGIVRWCIPKREGRAALFDILVAVETE